METPRPTPRRRLGWALVLLIAPLALGEAILLGLEPMPLPLHHRVLPGLLAGVALLTLGRALGRTHLGRGAGPLVAAATGMVAAAVSGFQVGGLEGLQLGLHLASGAALLGGAMLITTGRRPSRPRTALDRQLLLREATGKSKKKLGAEQVVAGQRVELDSGQRLAPIDARVAEGASRVQLTGLFEGARPVTKREGDPILAGSRVEGELVLEVVRPPESSLFAQARRHAASIIDGFESPDVFDRAIIAIVGLISIAAAGLGLQAAPDADWLARAKLLGTIGLLASGAPALLVRFRARARLVDLLHVRGLYLGEGRDLSRLLGFRKVSIAPELVSGPGEVEVTPCSDISPQDLLGVAAALFAEDDGPIAQTLRAELDRQGLGALRSAAQRRTQAVFHGTVGGVRWFIGPALAVESEEKLRLDEPATAAFEALAARLPIVLVLGRPDRGLVGLVGLSIGSDEVCSKLGRALGASLLPGQPDVVREAIALSSGLSARARPMRRRDLALMRFRDLPPSDGLVLRVAKESELLGHELSELSVVAEPALDTFVETLRLGRRVRWMGRLRTGLFVLGPALALFVAAGWPAFTPLFAAAFGFGLIALSTTP